MNTFTFNVIEADDGSGDLLLQLSEEFCQQEDWRPGDHIEWIDLKDGSWQMINRTKEARNAG